MGKKDKKPKRKHRLLEQPDTLTLGQQLTVEDIWNQYLLPEMQAGLRRPSTISNAARAVTRWHEWWGTLSGERLPVAIIRRQHIAEFRDWLERQGSGTPTQNESCGVIRQLLRCAERHELIERAPALERKYHRSRSPKLCLSFEEMELLWSTLERANWPRTDSHQQPLAYSPKTFWQVALILYSVYGFRTQELVQHEKDHRPLRWCDVYFDHLTPNPAGRMECEFGWIAYIPQKQERLKPEPLTNPLTRHTRAAIDLVRPSDIDPSQPVLDVSRSSVSFYFEWHRLLELAGVTPRRGSGVRRYLPKHLRKTATTWLNNHVPGLGPLVVGHSSDRSGQGTSEISERHYHNHEHMVCEGLRTLSLPACYDEVLPKAA